MPNRFYLQDADKMGLVSSQKLADLIQNHRPLVHFGHSERRGPDSVIWQEIPAGEHRAGNFDRRGCGSAKANLAESFIYLWCAACFNNGMWNYHNRAPLAASHTGFPSGSGSSSSSFIGETMRIQGTITSTEDLHLNGEIKGQVEAGTSRVTVGPGCKVEANVKAREVVVSGTVKGNVESTERVTLKSGANLVGDVKTSGIVIEDGAYFKGGIDITRPGSN